MLVKFRGTKFSRMCPFANKFSMMAFYIVITGNIETSVFRIVKISRLQANPRNQQNYFTLNISQYMVVFAFTYE